MLCKIVPKNGDEPVEIEIDTERTEVVETLIILYRDINKNVLTTEGFIGYLRLRGWIVTKKYPVLFDL